jgi:type IV secretion system protein VirD4
MPLIRLLLIITLLLILYAILATAYIVQGAWAVAVIIGLLVLLKVKGGHRRLYSHGTARWASLEDIEPLLDGDGLLVGQIGGKFSRVAGVKGLFDFAQPANRAVRRFLEACQRKQRKQFVRLTTACHISAFAPPGTGKSTGLAIPHLLTCRDAMIVIDFKGELYSATAKIRRKWGPVALIDPFHLVLPNGDTFNVLDTLSSDHTDLVDRCRALAEAIVVRTGQEKDPHWNDSAAMMISAMILVTCLFGEEKDRNLQSVRLLLSDPAKMEAAIKLLCASDACDGIASRIGHQLLHLRDKELASVMTTVGRHMRFLDTPTIAANTRNSTFKPRDILNKNGTVYLCIPPDSTRSLAGLLRLWIDTLVTEVIRCGLREERKVYFLLDEAAVLGAMDSIESALNIGRGYGLRLIFLYQSLGQLKRAWPEGQDQTLLSNTTQIFFGVNDPQTAEYVSNRLGDQTLILRSGGTSGGSSTQSSSQAGGGGSASYGNSWNTSSNWAEHGRKLLQPSELMTLDQRVALIFTPGFPPIATWLVRHYERAFKISRRMGVLKIFLDTFCLFITGVVLAALSTGILLNQPR